jgi:hypothetical protein
MVELKQNIKIMMGTIKILNCIKFSYKARLKHLAIVSFPAKFDAAIYK